MKIENIQEGRGAVFAQKQKNLSQENHDLITNWFAKNKGTRWQCAKALGLSYATVGRHIRDFLKQQKGGA